jgi:uncharacterized membrane-anchored protein
MWIEAKSIARKLHKAHTHITLLRLFLDVAFLRKNNDFYKKMEKKLKVDLFQ